ncbi:MAG: hypothetical protein K6B72_13900 [Lachnospiraceae bacterium]|nr:hypothetical protein [Lachnospiraceae bacterium]
MATAGNSNVDGVLDEKQQRARLKEERKKLKAEEKQYAKEQKAKRKEIRNREADLDAEDVGSGFATFVITLLIVFMWLAIMALLIRLDIGGLGSQVLAPVLGRVPVINKILPEGSIPQDEEQVPGQPAASNTAATQQGAQGDIIIPGTGTTGTQTTPVQDQTQQSTVLPTNPSISGDSDSNAYIQQLEAELAQAQQRNNDYAQTIAQQQAELQRLQPFEQEQAEFERVKADFYEQVIYAENGPGIEEYIKYYEGINPELAAQLYQEALRTRMDTEEVRKYAAAYASMKPKKAAGVFEDLVNNKGDAELAARILYQMSSDDRGKIMNAMDAEVAGVLTQLLEPDTLPGVNE